jgi:hypothetical protein
VKKETALPPLPPDALTVYQGGGSRALNEYAHKGLLPVGEYQCPACAGTGREPSKRRGIDRACGTCGGEGAVRVLTIVVWGVREHLPRHRRAS